MSKCYNCDNEAIAEMHVGLEDKPICDVCIGDLLIESVMEMLPDFRVVDHFDQWWKMGQSVKVQLVGKEPIDIVSQQLRGITNDAFIMEAFWPLTDVRRFRVVRIAEGEQRFVRFCAYFTNFIKDAVTLSEEEFYGKFSYN